MSYDTALQQRRCNILLNHGTRLVTEVCFDCGMEFAMAESVFDKRQADGRNFFCPAGHSQFYTGKKDEAERLRKELERANRQAANAQEEARIAWAEATESETKAREERKAHGRTKASLTKERKKAAAGVCPAEGCHRHFQNLQRHMASKHPELANDQG